MHKDPNLEIWMYNPEGNNESNEVSNEERRIRQVTTLATSPIKTPISLPRLSEVWRPPFIEVVRNRLVSPRERLRLKDDVDWALILPVIPYLTGDAWNSTIPPFKFPISPDHQLLPLIQYNVLRAIMTNMCIMSLLHRVPAECGAALAIPLVSIDVQTVPPWLLPTKKQLSVPHDVWIDTFPVAAMRDNLITYQDELDAEDLCCDTVGGLYEGYNDLEKRGLLVWSDPWTPDGWEVTEGFAKKWGYLLKGCDDLLHATNRWRAMRGEDKLIFDV